MILLASGSASRRAMLTAAGVAHEALSPGVDEEAAKGALGHLRPRDLADALAELKAVKVSTRQPAPLVLGSDSIVETADGARLDKAESREELAAQLRMLSGTTHRLWSAAVLAQGGRPVWRHVEAAKLTMRPLSDAFIEDYLAEQWPAVGACVGGYMLEGRGAQLFTKVEGSHFTVLGLPLLAVLGQLRVLGVVAG